MKNLRSADGIYSEVVVEIFSRFVNPCDASAFNVWRHGPEIFWKSSSPALAIFFLFFFFKSIHFITFFVLVLANF